MVRLATTRVFSAMPWVVLLLSVAAVARADYTPEELMSKSSEAHARLGRFSMQVWTRSFYWDEVILPYSESSIFKIVHDRPGVTALVGVTRRTYSSRDPGKKQFTPPKSRALVFGSSEDHDS